jgi:hypothetical protein
MRRVPDGAPAELRIGVFVNSNFFIIEIHISNNNILLINKNNKLLGEKILTNKKRKG